MREEALKTIESLCKWIQERCEKDNPGSVATHILPEVVKATAELINAVNQVSKSMTWVESDLSKVAAPEFPSPPLRPNGW